MLSGRTAKRCEGKRVDYLLRYRRDLTLIRKNFTVIGAISLDELAAVTGTLQISFSQFLMRCIDPRSVVMRFLRGGAPVCRVGPKRPKLVRR